MIRERTPEECLAVYAKHINRQMTNGPTELENYLQKPIDGVDLGDLTLQLTGASNHAVAVAISGLRPEAEQLMGWVERAAYRLTRDDDGWLGWQAFDALITAKWLTTGSVDGELAQRAVLLYQVDDLPETRISQVLRYIEAGQLQEAHAFVQRIPHSAKPGKALSSATALSLMVEHLLGAQSPPGFEKSFKSLLARLRRELFTTGLFMEIIPWVRIYNRVFVQEADPWVIVGWLRGDPTVTLPSPHPAGHQ